MTIGVSHALVAAVSLICLQDRNLGERSSGDGPEQVLEAIADGFLANRDAFAFATAKLLISEGDVSSFEAALAGTWAGEVRRTECVWVFDGRKVRYERHFKDENGPHEDTRVTDGQTAVLLIDDGNTADQARVTIRSVDEGGIGPIVTPFGLGLEGPDDSFHLAHLLKGVKQGAIKSRARFEGASQHEARNVYVISIDDEPDASAKGKNEFPFARYWIDPNAGFLIRKRTMEMHHVERKPELYDTLAVTSVRECSRRRFVTERAVLVDVGRLAGQAHHCREVKLLDFDADRRPSPDVFTITVPLGTGITNGINGVHYRAMEPQYAKVDPANLPNITHDFAKLTLGGRTKPPFPWFGSWWLTGLAALNIGVVLAIAVWFWNGWRRSKVQAVSDAKQTRLK